MSSFLEISQDLKLDVRSSMLDRRKEIFDEGGHEWGKVMERNISRARRKWRQQLKMGLIFLPCQRN